MKYIAIATAATVPGIWWLSTRHDHVPRFEQSPTAPLTIHKRGPSPDEVTRIISQGAYSFRVRSVAGIDRYDGAQLPANSPCEDRFMHGKFPSPWGHGADWMAWAVFDGHAGWQTAALLEKHLLPFVRHSLSNVRTGAKEQSRADLIRGAIMEAFVNLDDAIVKTAMDASRSKDLPQDKVNQFLPAYAGSCALLSVYDPVSSILYVACTGDSRAVLGQKGRDGKWEAIPLSVDQCGSNEEEIRRIEREHPGEENIAKDGRILGLMTSRAFGDSRWKWPLELQQDLSRRFYGPSPLTPKYNVRTPPYLTAEPVVTATKIEPGRPSFLINATDGLWWSVSDQWAVDLVGKWLDTGAARKRENEPAPTYEAFDFSQREKLSLAEQKTTFQDDNAAVHLIRNSLGGNHHELIASRLAFDAPFARRLRDDVTVQVVFFNKSSA